MLNKPKTQVKGLGSDIIEIERIQTSILRTGQAFLDRVFLPQEQAYCLKYKNPYPHFAARFAAKEAIVKAFGTGFGKHFSWTDIEIANDPHGKPFLVLTPKLQKFLQGGHIHLTISHNKSSSLAVALFEA